MRLKDSVFASKSERRGFQQIDSEWGHKYSLYPNLPFSIIFEPDKSISGTSNLFFKTSIDYTLCGKNDKPLLAIDFDGLGHALIGAQNMQAFAPRVTPIVKLNLNSSFATQNAMSYLTTLFRMTSSNLLGMIST